MCWVSIGYCEALAVGNWWYLVSRGHLCLYILHKVEIWKGVTHAWQTDWLTTLKDRATQLLIKFKTGALVTQCKSCPKFFGFKFEFSSILPLAPPRVQTYLTLVEEKLLFVSTLVCVSNSNLSLVFCVVIASKFRCEFLLEKLNGRCTGRGLGNQQTCRKRWMSVEQQLWQALFILIIDCLCRNMRTTKMREYGEEKQEDG